MISRIKAPTDDCVARLSELHRAAFAGVGRGWSADEIARLAAQGALIADDAGGGFALIAVAADEAELLTIAVAPSARRAGVGAALLSKAIAEAAKAEAGRMFLEVAADNAPALALYRRAGFRDVGRRPRYYARGAERIDAVMMEKSPLR